MLGDYCKKKIDCDFVPKIFFLINLSPRQAFEDRDSKKILPIISSYGIVFFNYIENKIHYYISDLPDSFLFNLFTQD